MGLTAISVLGAVALSVYSQSAIAQEQAQTPAAPAPAASAAAGAAVPAGGKGAQVYGANCSGCHGASGQGTPGTFPPLAKNAFVTGDPKPVVHAILYGLSGSIQVNGGTYNGQMPAWKGQLTNADIAAVATYVRSAWGNSAGAVTEADVAKVAK